MHFIEINARFFHSNLAIRYFRQMFDCHDLKYEHHTYTINQHINDIIYDLVLTVKTDKPIFFCSVYIWNIEYFTNIMKLLKDIYPKSIIVFGGPEVEHYDYHWIEKNAFVDILIKGEGETFFEQFTSVRDKTEQIDFLNKQKGIFDAKKYDMDMLGMPYSDEELKRFNIIYYETSRGCPYNCSYCVSSAQQGVRFKSLNKVKLELKTLFDANVPIIKFIDRTFNAPLSRAIEILEYLKTIDNDITTCHFELSPNLIDNTLLDVIKSLRKDLIQVEIGLQSANLATLHAINRHFDKGDWEMVSALCSLDNCHVHLDLIAGLPYEDYKTFKESFNTVIKLRPQHLQVGMLKFLNGAPIKSQITTFDYIYNQKPPYEFYKNQFISIEEKLALTALEEGTERIYNDDCLNYTVDFIQKICKDPFDAYYKMGTLMREQISSGYSLGKEKVVNIVIDYLHRQHAIECELVETLFVIDFLIANIKLPKGLRYYAVSLNGWWQTLILNHMPILPSVFQKLSPREILKKIKVVQVNYHYKTHKKLDAPLYVCKVEAVDTLYLFTREGIFYEHS